MAAEHASLKDRITDATRTHSECINNMLVGTVASRYLTDLPSPLNWFSNAAVWMVFVPEIVHTILAERGLAAWDEGHELAGICESLAAGLVGSPWVGIDGLRRQPGVDGNPSCEDAHLCVAVPTAAVCWGGVACGLAAASPLSVPCAVGCTCHTAMVAARKNIREAGGSPNRLVMRVTGEALIDQQPLDRR
jgi:hypothetical protein